MRVVRHSHDIEPATAVIEELPDGRTETGARPDAAKSPLEVAKLRYQNRCIEWATQRTAYKCGRAFPGHVDGLIHRRNFGDRDAVVRCV